jgi:hypothetical protein
MNQKEKLGYGVMIGTAIYIAGMYALFSYFGNSYIIVAIGFIGMAIVSYYNVKFMRSK